MLQNKLKVLFVFYLVICSCTKDKKTSQPDVGYEYFPNTAGSWIIYNVDSIIHDDFYDTIITYKYQVKEIIESLFTDNSGGETQRIERYKRSDSSAAWAITDVWYANRTSTTAERVEENIRYIKLIFPVKDKAKWNGNAYNTLGEKEYKYSGVNFSATVGNTAFDSVLTVLQEDIVRPIDKKYSVEKYAKNTGLVYKEYIYLDFQKSSGTEYKMVFSSKGK